MFAKLWFVTTLVICFSFFLNLAFVVPVKAVDPYVGDGPDNTMTASDEWQPVEAGKPLWFAVCFDQHKSPKATQVQLWSKPSTGATFLMLTPASANTWRKTGKIEPMGGGTPNPNQKATLFWEGVFDSTGKYYVVVKNTVYPGNLPISQIPPAYYKLLIKGGALVPCN